MAFMGNTVTVETITNAIAGSSIHLIHISTDQVYQGPGPHPEEIVCPSNIYGITKYAGELAAIACGATVFRTNFIGRSESQTRVSFTDWLFQVFKMKKAVTLFEDILFSPLNICDLCEIVANTINLKIPGVFNLGSKEGISKAEFAMNFGNYLNFDLSHAKIGQSSELGLKAKRPQDMRMVVGKFETAFGVSLPTISHTILLTAREYING
jgi:dTDP-4-dehydrorhamnose reductase